MLIETPGSGTRRTTLANYFAEFAGSVSPYLQYDNGYWSWSYTYAQIGAAARNFAAKLHTHG